MLRARCTLARLKSIDRHQPLAYAPPDNGHYDALTAVWEKAFFSMPLIHCEGPDLRERADRCVELARAVLEEAPAHLRPVYEFNAQQPVEHRKVIAMFGRHPHRNRVLGRESTPEEVEYVERGAFPHRRMPPEMKKTPGTGS